MSGLAVRPPFSLLAIWGFVLAFVVPVVGVVLSHVGHSYIRRGVRRGAGLAVWGIVLNYFMIFVAPVLAVVVIWICLCVVATAFGAQPDQLPTLGSVFAYVFQGYVG